MGAPEEMLPNLLANNSQSKINLEATQVALLAPNELRVIVANEASRVRAGKPQCPSLYPASFLPDSGCGCV